MNNFIPYEKIISLPPLVDFREPRHRDLWSYDDMVEIKLQKLLAFNKVLSGIDGTNQAN